MLKKNETQYRKDEEHHFYLFEGEIDVNDIVKYGGSEISRKQLAKVDW